MHADHGMVKVISHEMYQQAMRVATDIEMTSSRRQAGDLPYQAMGVVKQPVLDCLPAASSLLRAPFPLAPTPMQYAICAIRAGGRCAPGDGADSLDRGAEGHRRQPGDVRRQGAACTGIIDPSPVCSRALGMIVCGTRHLLVVGDMP